MLPGRFLDRPAISLCFLLEGCWLKGGWCCFCWNTLGTAALLVQRHGIESYWFAGFLGCSFSLVEISSKAGETFAPV